MVVWNGIFVPRASDNHLLRQGDRSVEEENSKAEGCGEERKTVSEFKVGDRVAKMKGYMFIGTVQAVFRKRNGDVRLVVEMDGTQMLHIYSPADVAITDLKMKLGYE